MFITSRTGFDMKFANGYRVAITPTINGQSAAVEVTDGSDVMVTINGNDSQWCTAEEVAEIIGKVSKRNRYDREDILV